VVPPVAAARRAAVLSEHTPLKDVVASTCKANPPAVQSILTGQDFERRNPISICRFPRYECGGRKNFAATISLDGGPANLSIRLQSARELCRPEN
jgi:hypothetical protein